MLITDTLKKGQTPPLLKFDDRHTNFLQELAVKTSPSKTTNATMLAAAMHQRFQQVQSILDSEWKTRLENAIKFISSYTNNQIHVGLSHGDFTPWNTFISLKVIYVFDWEYAAHGMPLSNDVIHFTLNEPQFRTLPPAPKLKAVAERLSAPWIKARPEMYRCLTTAYFVSETLRHLERLPQVETVLYTKWDSSLETASALDWLLSQNG